MIDIQIEFDVSEVKEGNWKFLREKRQKDALGRGAGKYLSLQSRRINRREDLNGSAFRQYSERYRDIKTRAGRMGENYMLRLTGRMMRSRTVSFVRDALGLSARISFDGSRPAGKIGRGAPGAQKRTRLRTASRGVSKGRVASHNLVVRDSMGDMVQNSFLAWVNHKLRPFIGFTNEERDKIFVAMSKILFKK